MIRRIEEKDREIYLSMAKTFYESDVVLSPIPMKNIEKTFNLLMNKSPFADAFIFEVDQKVAGYALLARTWSQEAGGEVIWIEEIFVCPNERKKGLGRAFFAFLEKEYPAARYRLEVEKENEKAVKLYKHLGFEFFPYDQMKKDF